MSIIRSLYGRFKSAEAIHDHLAETVEVRRDEPVTYTDLVEVVGAAAVKALDANLEADGLKWLQRQFAGAGVVLGEDRIQAVLSSLTDARKSDLDAVKALGVHSEPQYKLYGFSQLPTLRAIEDAIAGLAIDGRGISVAVSVTPGRESVAVSVYETAGSERVRTIHSFTAGQRNLTERQFALLAALLMPIKAYCAEVA